MLDERQRGEGPAVEDTVADAFAEEETAAEGETDHRGGIVLVDDDPVFRDQAKEKLGRLDDLEGLRNGGRSAGIVISAFVYLHQSPGPICVSYEVEEAFWVSLSALSDPARRVEYTHPLVGAETYPGILVGDPDRHVVWGLTYRFVEIFLGVVGGAA